MYDSNSTDKCTFTKKQSLLHMINAWLLGNEHCYFFSSLLLFILCKLQPLDRGPDARSPFKRPASMLGLVWFKQTGSGLCEIIQTTIIVEGPIRHFYLLLKVLLPFCFFTLLRIIGLFLMKL